MKWIALVLMTGDHVNTILFDRSLPYLYEIARVCFPIFAAVLAYNMVRPHADIARGLTRLLTFAVIAQPFHALAYGSFWPLNVLFTLALGIMVASRRFPLLLSLPLAAFAGAFVDYQWFGIALVYACFRLFDSKPKGRGVAAAFVFLALASLIAINGNLWAFAAVPLVYLVAILKPTVPRLKWAFYAYYPAHFAVLAFVAQLR